MRLTAKRLWTISFRKQRRSFAIWGITDAEEDPCVFTRIKLVTGALTARMGTTRGRFAMSATLGEHLAGISALTRRQVPVVSVHMGQRSTRTGTRVRRRTNAKRVKANSVSTTARIVTPHISAAAHLVIDWEPITIAAD